MARFLLIPLLAVFSALSSGFDAPKWDDHLFDRDAVELPPDEKTILVAALTGLASNFFDSPTVDEDAREKAIFLALAIDPLDHDARNTYRALVQQEKPTPAGASNSGLGKIAETLWRHGEKLKNGPAPTPESVTLALHLQELSLVIDPNPEPERVGLVVKDTGNSPLKWKPLTLQPGDSPSSSRMKKLAAHWQQSLTAAAASPPPEPKPEVEPPPPLPPPSSKKMLAEPPANSFSLMGKEGRLHFVLPMEGRKTLHLPGTVSLLVRPPESEDRLLLRPEMEANDGKLPRITDMKLTGARSGVQMQGLNRAEAFLKKHHLDWPMQEIAEFRFNGAFAPSFQSPLTRSLEGDFSLAAALLLESAFSGKLVTEKMMFLGTISKNSDNDSSATFLAGPDVAESILAVHDLRDEVPDFLLLPGDQQANMLQLLVGNRDLRYLFDPQLIAFSTWEELKSTAFGSDRDALLTASSEFRAIQAVQDKMSLIDLSRNEKVKERLTKILEIFPRHLSARLMLDFGNTPDDPKALIRQAVRESDEVLAPVLDYIHTSARQIRRGVAPDPTGVESKFRDIDKVLADRSNSAIAPIKPYLFECREMIKKVEIFSTTTNKTSSVGQQRMNDIKQAVEKLNAEREKLEVAKIVIEDTDDDLLDALMRKKFRPPFLR